MKETGATVLAVDAGRTLLLDRDEMLARANGTACRWSGMNRPRMNANERQWKTRSFAARNAKLGFDQDLE